MSEETSWMDSDDGLNIEGNERLRRDQKNKAIEFARNYLVFETDERAKAIWAHWQKILDTSTPTNASTKEYVADNAIRDFILKIKRQLEMAKQEPM